MSNFLAEAQVLIRPDTSKFRALLLAELAVATRALPPIPVAAQVVTTGVAGAGAAAAAAASSELIASQAALQASAGSLARIEELLTGVFAQQTTVLEGLTAAELQAAGAQAALDRQSKRTAATLAGLGTATGKLDAALLGLRTAVGSAAVIGLGAGALAAILLGKGLRAASDIAADFETQMNVLGATTGASADEILIAAEAARRLGEDASLPGVAAGDAAQAITELSKAGLDLQNSITGARGVLELATAASIDNAAATELAANALNAFRLEADQTTRVADVLANSSIAAQGSIEDVGIALQQSAAAAAQVGVSFEDTIALLTLLAKGGLRASDAGTSFRVALLRLAAPSKEAREILQSLNIQVRDLQGNIRPEVFAEFAAATASLSPEIRDAAAAAVFGQDAFRAFSLIGREGAAGLAQVRSELERSGTAADLAGARTEGFAGRLGALSSEAETLGVSVGQLINTGLTPLVNTLIDVTAAANAAADGLRNLDDIAVNIGPEFPGLEKLSNDILRLLLVPFAPWQQFVEDTKDFAEAAGGAGTIVEQLNARLESTRSRMDDAFATGRREEGERLARQVGVLERAVAQFNEKAAQTGGILATSAKESAVAADAFERRFREIGDAASRTAEQEGEKIGQALAKGVGEGFSQDVVKIVNDAKQNLLSIGDNLAAQIGQLIDAGPLGQQLERLQNALAERRGARQRLGLLQDLEDAQRQLKLAQLEAGPLSQALERLQEQLDRLRRADTQAGAASTLRQAEADLREARESIAGIGRGDTARQRQDIAEFLEPFIENVRSAKSALQQQNLEGRIDKLNQKIADRKELFAEDEVATARRRVAAIKQAIQDFDDQAVIEGLQKTIEAQKKAVAEGIANLITQFATGQIKLKELNKRLATLIGNTVGPFETAGNKLGLAFANKFLATVTTFFQQARLISQGPALPGAAFQAPSVVNVNEQIQALKDTAKNTGEDGPIVQAIKAQTKAVTDLARRVPPATKPATGAGSGRLVVTP